MCGIAGFYNYHDPSVLRKMTDVLIHRGPDDSGYAIFPTASLGHRRLSIVDTSSCGHQPMCDDRGEVWITYNGEVYNFEEKKKLLQKHGYRFKSRTDTEVVLYLYKEFGVHCLNHMRGMFTFAIWDQRNRQLFLARDHLGVKPLYYWRNGTSIFFASEIKSLLQVPEYHAGLNNEVLPIYLSLQYVPGPATLFGNILRLQAGSYLIARDDQVRIEKYWDVRIIPDEEKSIGSTGDAKEQLKFRLEESVKSQMMSDVPLGAFLSGGIDSSTIVSLMAKHSTQPLKTFSIGFDGDKRCDEARYSNLVSERFNCVHHAIVMQPRAEELIPEIVRQMDEPIADPAIIPTYLLARFASKEVSVVQTGEGADELLGGYKQYRLDKLYPMYSFLPDRLRVALRDIAGRRLKNEKIERAINTLTLHDSVDRWISWSGVTGRLTMGDILNEDVKIGVLQRFKDSVRNEREAADALDEWLRFDLKYWLPDDLLMKVDKSTMAWSLEGRVPYLDHELVEFCFGLPVHLKATLFGSKRLLRSVASDFLSPVIYRRPKHGFNLPLAEWFRNDLSDLMNATLSDLQNSRLFNMAVITRLFKEHMEGMKDHSRMIFTLVIFSEWHKQFITRGS